MGTPNYELVPVPLVLVSYMQMRVPQSSLQFVPVWFTRSNARDLFHFYVSRIHMPLCHHFCWAISPTRIHRSFPID